MSNNDTINEFVAIWSAPDKQPKATCKDIQDVESTLGFNLPKGYVEIVTNFGSVYCPDLLDAIVEEEADLSDVQNFDLPQNMIKNTEMCTGMGMPEGFICFASDCMGNMFCFKIDECKDKQEAGIWFFDHDFCEIEKIFNNFNEWLEAYIALATVNK